MSPLPDQFRQWVTPATLPRQSSAFTLIELLVVVAIIAILASLLIPGIARGKEQGRKAVCIGNFRQLHIAWQLYIDDNNGQLPTNFGSVSTTAGVGPASWTAGVMARLPDWLDNTNSALLIHGEVALVGKYLSALPTGRQR